MVKGCHWNLDTSGTWTKSHDPALYLKLGLMILNSMAPEGWTSNLESLVDLLARISLQIRSPKYKIPGQMVNLQLRYPMQCLVE